MHGYCNGNTIGYEGPCPPDNEHTYLFKLYAVDKTLAETQKQGRKKMLSQIKGHIVAQAVLNGKYKQRNK